MKTTLKILLKTFITLMVIPFLGVTFLPSDWNFPFLLLTLYILNPAFFIYLGALVGKNIKNSWCYPLLALLIFAISSRLIYGTLDLFLVGINVIVCGVSILITHLFAKRRMSKEIK